MNSAVSTLTSIHPSGAALLHRTLRQAKQPVIQVTGVVKPNQDILAAAKTLASWPLPIEEEEEEAA